MRFAPAQPRHRRSAAGRTHVESATPGLCVALIPPPPPSNPYLELLYRHLEPHGIRTVESGSFHAGWLWMNRRRVQLIHFNWPEGLWTYRRGPGWLRRAASWLKLMLFAGRLRLARALGYRLAWTIHQVYPHESIDRTLDHRAAVMLARACDLLIAHDTATATSARRELGPQAESVEVIAHGSYVDVYPAGRTRAAVRAELDIPDDAFVYLSFGELRGYKDVDLLLDAFSDLDSDDVALVVAGHPKNKTIGARVAAASAADDRVRPILRFVRTTEVAEIFAAADAAVIARGDGGTSGSLVLALSMGLPPVVADRPAYRALLGDGETGWVFAPGDRRSLARALAAAAGDREEARARGRAARVVADGLAWPDIAAQAVPLLTASAR